MSYGTAYDHIMMPPSFSFGNMTIQPLYPIEDCVGTDQTWLEDLRTFPPRGQRQALGVSAWQQQSNIPQYFDNEVKKAALYSSNLSLALPFSGRPGMDAVSSFPQVAGPRMDSPVPSQDLSTPTSSNPRSPATESEYADTYGTPQIHDDLLFPNDASYPSPEVGSSCAGRPQLSLFGGPSGASCVNLSEVQAWSDPQEVDPTEDVFASNSRYFDMSPNEYSIEVDISSSKSTEPPASYRRSLTARPELQVPREVDYTQADDQFEAASDMEADLEEDAMVEDEASDTEYTPKTARLTKRRSNKPSKPSSSSAKGRSRVSKSRGAKVTKRQLTYSCKTCKDSFNNADTLKRHIEGSHQRAFTCVFNFAGCPKTFGSKNEWKRHVSTKHLIFNTWVCNIDKCGKSHDPTTLGEKAESAGQANKAGTFNRKDLFTQHLRRMHPPPGNRPQDKQNKQNAKWEEDIKALQQSCRQIIRSPPKTLKCPVDGCETMFEGQKCWDDRMEHVAKHLENVANTKNAPSVRHENDELLVSWAVTESIIERVGDEYKVIPTAIFLGNRDLDAEGEYKY